MEQEIGDGSPLKAMTEDVHDLHFVQHKGSWRSLLMASGPRVKRQGTSEEGVEGTCQGMGREQSGMGREESQMGREQSQMGREQSGHWEWNSAELARYLPKTGFLERGEWRTCAVVGSAWHMDGSGFGSEIDAHQVAARAYCCANVLCLSRITDKDGCGAPSVTSIRITDEDLVTDGSPHQQSCHCRLAARRGEQDYSPVR